MGVSCGNINNNTRRILDLKAKYPAYHIKDPNLRSKESERIALQHSEDLLFDHLKIFLKYKEELEKSYSDLYRKFFTEDLDKLEIEVKNLRAEDEIKFLYFFNKREFKTLKMLECNVKFPKVKYINLF
jgi:hypothetical protein